VNGSGASGLKGSAAGVEREAPPRERDGEAAAALWLALCQRAATTALLTLDQIETPSAWHPSAGELTPTAAPVGAGGSAPDAPQAPERMTLRVDGGELGELSVTLDRESGALRVVIGLENQRAVGSVLPDAPALRRALEGVGVSVQSLSVVTQAEVGTVLAQRRLNPSGQKPGTESEGSDRDPEADRKRHQKRLKLIG
jgi:flagellar hook-length control protein FliK